MRPLQRAYRRRSAQRASWCPRRAPTTAPPLVSKKKKVSTFDGGNRHATHSTNRAPEEAALHPNNKQTRAHTQACSVNAVCAGKNASPSTRPAPAPVVVAADDDDDDDEVMRTTFATTTGVQRAMADQARMAGMANAGAAPRRLAGTTARTMADTRHSMGGNCVVACRTETLNVQIF
jgi:hypothetical protein